MKSMKLVSVMVMMTIVQNIEPMGMAMYRLASQATSVHQPVSGIPQITEVPWPNIFNIYSSWMVQPTRVSPKPITSSTSNNGAGISYARRTLTHAARLCAMS